MKTKYLVPQTEMYLINGESLMDVGGFSPNVHPGAAPERNGFAPGGGDLGGIPAA